MFTRTIKFAAASMVALAISLAASTASATVSAPINVVVPPLAYEDTHITVSWQKPTTTTGIVGYNVYVNGTKKGSVTTVTWASGLTNNLLYYDCTGLTAGTSYSIKVRSYDSIGRRVGRQQHGDAGDDGDAGDHLRAQLRFAVGRADHAGPDRDQRLRHQRQGRDLVR